MASSARTRVVGALLGAAALIAALMSLAAANAATSSPGVSPGVGAAFPAHTLMLTAPVGIPVTVPRIHVSENGKPVDALSVTPVHQANAGDFGVVLVIDQSQSMRGAELAQEMASARAVAAQRTGNRKLGVITFDAAAHVLLPLTSDSSSINRALHSSPPIGTGTRILPALTVALKQFADGNIADGAVILMSDGANESTGGLTPQSVGAAAQAQHVRIFTVGLQDSTSNLGLMRRLARLGGGRYTAATGAQLPHLFTTIASTLTSTYLLRYTSTLPAGENIAVKVSVNGIGTPFTMSYHAPSTTTSSAPKASSSTRHAASGRPSPSPAAGAAKTASSHSRHRAASVPRAPAVPLRPPAAAKPRLSPTPRSAPQLPPWTPAAARHSFWTSPLANLVVGVLCALLIVLAIATLLFHQPAGRALQRRLASFTARGQTETDDPVLTEGAAGPLARLLAKRRFWPGFVEQVQAARIERSPLALVKRWAVGSVFVAVALTVVIGSALPGVLVVLVAPFVMRVWVKRAARKKRNLFGEQLPTNLQDLAGAMRGGRSFIGAVSAVADTSGEPMRGELERAVTDERLGLPLEDTLEAIAGRMESKDMKQVALIAALHRSSGSNVAEALDRVAGGSRERADLAREMRALTGQARMSSWVLSGLPAAMLLALSAFEPHYVRPLFHTVPGIVLLVVGTGMVICGFKVMQKICTVQT